MSKSTKSAKPAAAAVVDAFAQQQIEALEKFTQGRAERVAYLSAALETETNRDNIEAFKREALDCNNRISRATQLRSLLDRPEYAAVASEYQLSAERFTNAQIYAQDKVLAMLKALTQRIPLSAVSRNVTTQGLVQAMDTYGALSLNKKDANGAAARLHDCMRGSITLGTASAQASSSRQCLEAFGMIAWDEAARTFKLSERGEAARDIIAK